MGGSGVGKTHLIMALINERIKKIDSMVDSTWPYPAYFNASDLLATIREKDFVIPASCFNNPWLIIDDIGSENISDWSREIFYRILDGRISKGLKHTFITTNLDMNDFKTRFLERTSSRIIETCVPVNLGGSDWRLKKLEINANHFYNSNN